MEEILFMMFMYTAFGMMMELLSSGIKHGFKKPTPLLGEVSLLMVPVYAIFLTAFFPPVMHLIDWLPAWIRFAIYGVLITLSEYLIGLFYDKVCKIRAWDYSKYSDKIGNGYTRASLFAFWGWCGLWLESYTGFIEHLSKYISCYFM